MLRTLRRMAWLVTAVIGIGFLVGGIYAVVTARDTRSDVVAQIERENIRTTEDAEIPNQPVNDVVTAEAMAEVIDRHARETTGGLTYAELERDDPRRDVYLTAANLRTSLNSFIMAYEVTRLVEGLGWALIAGAVAVLAIGVPTVYSVTHRLLPAAEEAGSRGLPPT